MTIASKQASKSGLFGAGRLKRRLGADKQAPTKPKKKKNEMPVRSSAARCLTFIAAAGESVQSFEMRRQDDDDWLARKMMATLYDVGVL
ncbi:MAG: hypothetical protein LBT62_08670 [Deltaproteobacteria bacterium]|nr:hypothetical protein [Deltaproteobacteria bacterium]